MDHESHARTLSGTSGQPERLGPYRIVSTLGWGGMGVVYEAEHEGRHCALKILRFGPDLDGLEHRRFEREATAASQLHHPNIVEIHATGTLGDCAYLEMELVRGRHLAHWLGESGHSLGDRIDILVKIAHAVDHAHRTGILHRDLKPANILVDEQGEPKVADFGLARIIGSDPSLTPSSAALGTPAYMAPEQARGLHRDCGPPADVWSLGVILYEMLTGEVPFQADSALAVLAAVCHDEPLPPSRLNPELPRELDRITLQCLDKNPKRRYPSARELADDLNRQRSGQRVLASSRGCLWIASHFGRRHRIPILLAIIATLGLVLGAVLMRPAATASANWLTVLDLDCTAGLPEQLDFTDAQLVPLAPEEIQADHRGLSWTSQQWCWITGVRASGDVALQLTVQTPELPNGIELLIGSARVPTTSAESPQGYSCQFSGWLGSIDCISRNPRARTTDTVFGEASRVRPESEHVLRFERLGETLRIWVDGVIAVEQVDELPVIGPELEHAAIRHWGDGLVVKRIQVQRLASGTLADPLAAADGLLRSGNPQAALDQYRLLAVAHEGTPTGARALARACTTSRSLDAPDTSELVRRLRAAYPDAPARLRVEEALIIADWSAGELDVSLAGMREVLARNPQSRIVASCLAAHRPQLQADQRALLLQLIEQGPRLPVLKLEGLGLDRLPDLRDKGTVFLTCQDNRIAELELLRGAPLRWLICANNPITSLAPLAEAPLIGLVVERTQITDLQGIDSPQLLVLAAGDSPLQSIDGLRSTRLRSVHLSSTGVSDLSPLAGASVRELDINHCPVVDLAALRSSPLHSLRAYGCRIRSLAPLQSPALEYLTVDDNPITDWGPVLERPPAVLHFGHPAMDPAILDQAAEAWQDRRPVLARTARAAAAQLRDDLAALHQLSVVVGDERWALLPIPLDWPEARALSERLGGHLAWPSGPEAFAALDQLLPTDMRAWLDAHHAAGTVTRSDGTPVAEIPYRFPSDRQLTGHLQWHQGGMMIGWEGLRHATIVAWPRGSVPSP